ncbi:MAG: acyltransferase [Bacteroidetes bacterium]|nr:acyltransferase [Bacteroidota bacterium]MBL0033505.1 acyltransferase [Bacteroidota bacterium]
MNRLYNLDYLRGLSAFGIMIYHYLSLTYGNFSSDTFMGRLGLYGVAIFYVLSGLTLYYVYYEKMKPSLKDVLDFFKKRFFRIFPLLWLVTFISIMLSGKTPDPTDLFLNLSGLFGFIRWDKSFSTGVWSIGNEIVFYIFFPFFILLIKKFKPLMIMLSLAILVSYLYFAFVKLSPDLLLSEQWKNYVNPLNQVFLFLGGFLIGYFLHNIKIKNTIVLSILLFGMLLFTFYPTTGNVINIVTGTNRLIFSTCCFLICICFYKLTFKFPAFIHKPLTLLGEASYSVYLLHPIIWIFTGIAASIFRKRFFYFPELYNLILSVIFTLIISFFVYQYFEKYFMKLGHTKRNINAK